MLVGLITKWQTESTESGVRCQKLAVLKSTILWKGSSCEKVKLLCIHGESFEYLSGWPEQIEEEIITLCLCLAIFIDFWSCCIANNSIGPLQGPPQFFQFVQCHSLSLVVNRCTTRCHSMYHSSVFLKMIFLSWISE